MSLDLKSSKASVVEARNLKKSYRQGDRDVQVLKGLNLDIHSGDCVALLGASGSGKSTLLHLIGALDRGESGELKVLNTNLASLKDSQRADFRLQNIGFVFQFHHLIPELTALENVCLPAALKGKKSEARGLELLDWMGLSGRVYSRPYQMSGGEQQRVALARALVNDPKLLLTDEATGNLDRERAAEVLEILFKANRELGTTLISVTHDADLAGKYARTLRLNDGLF